MDLVDSLKRLKQSNSEEEKKNLLIEIRNVFYEYSNWDQLEYNTAIMLDPHDGVFNIVRNYDPSGDKLLNILTYIATKFPTLLIKHSAVVLDFLKSFTKCFVYSKEQHVLFIIKMYDAFPLEFLDGRDALSSLIRDHFNEKVVDESCSKELKNLCQLSSFMLEKFCQVRLLDEEIENLSIFISKCVLSNRQIHQHSLKSLKYLAIFDVHTLSKYIEFNQILREFRNFDGKNSDLLVQIMDLYIEKVDWSPSQTMVNYFCDEGSTGLESPLLRERCAFYYFKLFFKHHKEDFTRRFFSESKLNFSKVFCLKFGLSTGLLYEGNYYSNESPTHFFHRTFVNIIENLDLDKYENMELLLMICYKSPNHFYDNRNFLNRILSSLIISYKDSNCYEQHVKNVFLFLYCFDKFKVDLFPIVYNAVISQCNHQWIADYSLIKNKKGYTSYHNYIELWSNLMTYKPKCCFIEIKNLEEFHLKIINLFITAILKTFDDLVKPHHFELRDHGIVDPALSYDFITIFENCASLFSCVILKLYKKPKISVFQRLIFVATQCSLKFPFVHGFYSIISTCFKIFNLDEDFDSNQEIKNIVFNYINGMLKKKVIFDTDFSALAETVISFPICFIAQFQIEISDYLKNIFKNRLYGVAVIEKCLNAVVSWVNSVGVQKLEVFLKNLLPSLRSLVSIEDSASGKLRELAHDSFEKFIELIGLLPRNLCEFLLKRDMPVDTNFRVSLEMPIVLKGSIKFLFEIDQIIRFICFVANETAVGEKRHLAFQSLHSFCLFSIGLMSKDLDLCSVQDYQKFLFSLIENIIFSLSNFETEILKMFESLLLEICHLFATRPNYYSCFSSKLIDILMRGISYETSLETRQISQKCLREFTSWSYKYFGEANNSINCRHLLTTTICYGFLHVSLRLRIGSAKAFNCVAKIYLEEREYVNKYSIYILTFMISSLERYDETNYELSDSLKRLESSMIECSELLLSKEEREQPHEIEYATMECLFDWLLEKCMSTSFECRKHSLLIMTSFCRIHKDEMTHLLPKKFFNFIERYKNIKFDPQDLSWIPHLCAIIDYYHFNIKNNENLNSIPEFVLEAFRIYYQTETSIRAPHFTNLDRSNLILKCKLPAKILEILKSLIKSSELQQKLSQHLNDFLVWIFGDVCRIEENAIDVIEIALLFKNVPYSILNQIKTTIVDDYNNLVLSLFNSIDNNRNFFLDSKVNYLSRLDSFRIFKTAYDNMLSVDFSSFEIINKIISTQLDDLHDYKYDVIRSVLETSLSMETQNASWLWNAFFLNNETLEIDVYSTPQFKLFFLFKDLFCNFILENTINILNLESVIKLAILKEILNSSLINQNLFGNILLKSVSSNWTSLKKWLCESKSRKNLFVDFLYHLGKSLRISWHKKSEISIWLRGSSDVINYKKHFIHSENGDSVCLFTIFKYSLNFNLISDLCFWIINAENRQVEIKEISKFLLSTSLSNETQSLLLHDLFEVGISNEGVTDKRLELIKYVFIPLSYKCSHDTIYGFHVDKLNKLWEIVSKELPCSFPDEEHIKLICQKTICYMVLETMFGIFHEKDVLKCFTEGFTNTSKHPKDLLLNSYLVRKLKPQDLGGRNYLNHWRSLQCAAFNLAISIVCNRSEVSMKGEFYDKYVFNIHKKWNWILWEKITYKQDFKFLSYSDYLEKFKISTSLKFKRDKKTMLKRNKYVRSVSLNLSTSSSSQECKTYDFIGKSNVSIKKQQDEVEFDFKEFEFYKDSINMHECMGNLCGAIHQTVYDGFTNLEDPNSFPNWMKPFFISLSSKELSTNGKLFILKVIFNCRDIFKPYSRRFINAVAKTVLLIPPLFDHKLNQFLNDCVFMLISWKDIASPDAKYVWRLIEKLLPPPEMLLEKSNIKQNSILIRKILNNWNMINPDLSVIEKLMKSNNDLSKLFGLQVFKEILTHKISGFNEALMTEFFERFLPELHSKNFELHAEIIGLMLRSDEFVASKSVKVKECLSTLYIKDRHKYAHVLYNIQKNFPMSPEYFLPWIIKCLENPKEIQIHTICLLILNEFLQRSSDINENIIEKLNQIFPSVKSENVEIQQSVLEIILTCFQKYREQFLPSIILENMEFLIKLSQRNEKMRSTFCNLLICINTNMSLDASMDGNQEDFGLDYLFSCLFDNSSTIRNEVFKFWLNYLSSLEIDKIFIFIIEYSLKSSHDTKFFGVLVNLMMKILEKQRSFDENIFNSSLVQCSYKEKVVEPFKFSNYIKPYVPPFVKLADLFSSKSETQDSDVFKYVYYSGEYPRTDITLKNLLNPLLSLCLVDEELSKKVLTSLMNGLMSEFKKNDLFDDLKTKLGNVLQKFKKHPMHPIILELLIRNDIYFNIPSDIFVVNNIQELGILYFEKSILNEKEVVENPAKRIKLDFNFQNDTEYIKNLIRLYISIDEDKIAYDIFADHFTENKEEFLCSLFSLKAMEKNSDWDQLDKLLQKLGISCERWDVVTDYVPLLLKSTVHQALIGNIRPSWIESATYQQKFGAEISMLYSSVGDFANLILNSKLSLRSHLSILNDTINQSKDHLNYDFIIKLKSLVDIYCLTRSSFVWNDFVQDYSDCKTKSYLEYRAYCRELNDIKKDSANFGWMVNLIDFAILNEQLYMARRYWAKLFRITKDTPNVELIAKIKRFEIGLLKENSSQDLSIYWEQLNHLIRETNSVDLDDDIKSHLTFYISKLCSLSSEIQVTTDIRKDLSYLIPIETTSSNLDKLSIFKLGFDCLLHRAPLFKESSQKGKAYHSAALFCRKFMKNSKDISCDSITISFVKSILLAMRFGSIESQNLFPAILNHPDVFENADFQKLIFEIPPHMFLQWIPQLLSVLNQSQFIVKLLEVVFKEYPERVCILFLHWKEMNFEKNKSIIELFYSKAQECFLLAKRIIEGLSQLCHPNLLLISYLKDLVKAFENNTDKTCLYENIFSRCFYRSEHCGKNQMVGKIYEKNNIHENFLITIKNDESKTVKEKCDLLRLKISDIETNVEDIDEQRLDQFSPFLAYFSPQKGKFDIPVSNSFVRNEFNLPCLVRFDTKVENIKSLRSPIKINMCGSDGRRYSWLVKFGEDMRQDQRIMQLFDSVNHSFKRNPSAECKVITYQVIPLKHKLGLIEFLPFQTMSKFLNTSDSYLNLKRINIKKDHEKWMRKSFLSETIGKKDNDIINHYQMCCKQISDQTLRNALLKKSMSPQHFYDLRSNFLKKYSVLCVIHWILGIGDRHLNNFLISKSECDVIGIDYGHVFDIKNMVSSPELIPFRMTPQFFHLYSPLGKSGILHHLMTSAFDFLDVDAIIWILKLFIKEPNVLESLTKTTTLKSIVKRVELKLSMQNPIPLLENVIKEGALKSEEAQIYCSLIKNEFSRYESLNSSKELVDLLIEIATNKTILGLMPPLFEAWI